MNILAAKLQRIVPGGAMDERDIDALGKTSPCRQSFSLCRSQFTFFECPDTAAEDYKYSSVDHPIFITGCLRSSKTQSFYLSSAPRPPWHREMLIGHAPADNRIEKRTAEKVKFVLRLTLRSTTGWFETVHNSQRFLRRDATREMNRICRPGNKKAAPYSARLDLTAKRLRAP
jgi:hypothetical protein